MSRTKHWARNLRWSVEANTPDKGWAEIYCTRTQAEAMRDAERWGQETGQETRIVPGPGHPDRRDR